MVANAFPTRLSHRPTNMVRKSNYVLGFFACMYVCTPLVGLVPVEVVRKYFVPWNWSNREL